MSNDKPLVGIILGSKSDAPDFEGCKEMLEKFGVPYEFVIHSAHRNPDDGRVWEGDVVQVSGPRDSLPFSNAQELSKILSSQPV